MVTVAADFEPSILRAVVDVLAAKNISIDAYGADASGLRIYPSNVDDAKAALSEAGYFCQIVEVLSIDVKDRAGILRDVLDCLHDCQASIISSFGMGIKGEGRMYIRVDDVDSAKAALEAS